MRKNNGITLISLVITIVLMLILAGVTIKLAVTDGLFEYASNAVGDTQNAMEQEQELINDIMNNHIKPHTKKDNTGGNGGTTSGEDEKIELPEGIKVGDYVNYTPSNGTYTVASGENGSGWESEQSFMTDTTLKWRVWSIDEKTGIELISDKAVHTVYLKGADGYNHGVDILNDMCKALYSNTNGATARSINIDDINSKTTYKVEEDSNYKETYGKVYTFSNVQYPKIYTKELGSTEKGLNETAGNLLTGSQGVRKNGIADYETYTGSSTANTLYVTNIYYSYEPERCLSSKNTELTGLIYLGRSYWLASRCVDTGREIIYFNLWVIDMDGELMRDRALMYDNGDNVRLSNDIRPIVSLNSSVKLTKDEKNTTTTDTYWDIKF